MRVIDVIELLPDYQDVWIIDHESKDVVACYDGRNSIPKCLNENTVKSISTRNFGELNSILNIEI